MKKLYLSLMLMMTACVASLAQRNISTTIDIVSPASWDKMKIGTILSPKYVITNTGPDTIKVGDTIKVHDVRHKPGQFTPFFYTVDIAPGTSITLDKVILGSAAWDVYFDTLYTSGYPNTVQTLWDKDDPQITNPAKRKVYTHRFADSVRYAWYVEIIDITSPKASSSFPRPAKYNSTGMGFKMDTVHVWSVGIPTSIRDIYSRATANVNVFPNPASNRISFEFDYVAGQDLDIQVFDISGRNVVHTSEKANASGVRQTDLALPQLPAGNYYLQLSDGYSRRSASFSLRP